MSERPFAPIIALLQKAGLRPTRQRMALARLLFDGPNRHVTAEELQREAISNNIRVSLATIYNTLHQFTEAGLLREVVVDTGRAYFDTNTSSHHHFYFEDTGRIQDIPADQVKISALPGLPEGVNLNRVDVVVRVSQAKNDS